MVLVAIGRRGEEKLMPTQGTGVKKEGAGSGCSRKQGKRETEII